MGKMLERLFKEPGMRQMLSQNSNRTPRASSGLWYVVSTLEGVE